MTLEALGYNSDLENFRKQQHLDAFGVGRILIEHKDRYIVKTADDEFEGELIGNLRHTAKSRTELPAVGDWVAISEFDAHKVLIYVVFPRHSKLERQAVGKQGHKQLIATNIDYGLIIQAVNRDLNINRLERYLTICHTSKIEPIVLLSKVDLITENELKTVLNQVYERLPKVPIIPISNETGLGLDTFTGWIQQGKTYCLLGSSGVGKSTLINKLTNSNRMDTGAISQGIDRGKHVTTHRELVLMENGGIIIDNPGMREVGITDTAMGLEMTFDDIVQLSEHCKFNDCTHTNEKGCALLVAIENGEVSEEAYSNYQKMERERIFFESSQHEKRKKDKHFGKMIKGIQKQRRANKY